MRHGSAVPKEGLPALVGDVVARRRLSGIFDYQLLVPAVAGLGDPARIGCDRLFALFGGRRHDRLLPVPRPTSRVRPEPESTVLRAKYRGALPPGTAATRATSVGKKNKWLAARESTRPSSSATSHWPLATNSRGPSAARPHLR